MKNANKIRPLCLSFWTPPAVRPQAILIGKMIPEWLRQGMHPVIITFETCGQWDIDAPIYKIPHLRMNKYLRRIPLMADLMERNYYQKLFRLVAPIVQTHGLNIVYSFANPQSSNILGAMLKEKLGIKFISHFSDPWYDDPYETRFGRAAKKMLKQETYIMSHSDRIIIIADKMKDLIMKKYPASWQKKVRVIPHCYDPQDYPEVKKEIGEKFILSHLGIFRKQRNPKMFFQAIRNVLTKRPYLYKTMAIKLVGSANAYTDYREKDLAEEIVRFGLEEIVEIVPTVSYKESLRIMRSSDCLVAIDANFNDSPFIVSKVIDYAASGTPIIGIAPEGNPTAEFLSNAGYRCFNYSQADELADYIEKLLDGKIKPQLNRAFFEQFHVSNTTIQLFDQFEEVLYK